MGDQVTLKLMRREKGSLLAIPVTNPQIDPPVSFSYLTDNIDNQAHSKLLIAEFTDVSILTQFQSTKFEQNISLIRY